MQPLTCSRDELALAPRTVVTVRIRCAVRRFHRQSDGGVIAELFLLIAIVMPIWATAPAAIELLTRYFYRITVVVSGPFT